MKGLCGESWYFFINPTWSNHMKERFWFEVFVTLEHKVMTVGQIFGHPAAALETNEGLCRQDSAGITQNLTQGGPRKDQPADKYSLTSWSGNYHLTGTCGYDSHVYIANVWMKVWGGISGKTLGLDSLFGRIFVDRKFETSVRKEVRIKQVWVCDSGGYRMEGDEDNQGLFKWW